MNKIAIELPNVDIYDPRWPTKYLCLYRDVKETRKYTVGAPLTFVTSDRLSITVHPGFVTDGGSVPRLFWWYVAPFTGPEGAAFVIHDILYAAKHGKRDWCDDIMLDALHCLPVRKAKASALVNSVRIRGDSAWNEKQPEDIAKARQLLEVTKLQ